MKELLVGNAPCSWGTLEHQDQSKAIPFDIQWSFLDSICNKKLSMETLYLGVPLRAAVKPALGAQLH